MAREALRTYHDAHGEEKTEADAANQAVRAVTYGNPGMAQRAETLTDGSSRTGRGVASRLASLGVGRGRSVRSRRHSPEPAHRRFNKILTDSLTLPARARSIFVCG